MLAARPLEFIDAQWRLPCNDLLDLSVICEKPSTMILKEPPNRTATPNCHFRPPIESRADASGNPVLTRGIWIPACAGMTIYSRCVDTHARREREFRGYVHFVRCSKSYLSFRA